MALIFFRNWDKTIIGAKSKEKSETSFSVCLSLDGDIDYIMCSYSSPSVVIKITIFRLLHENTGTVLALVKKCNKRI